MANRIEMSHEQSCGGLCSGKDVVIEGLFITTTETSCCETTQNVIPMANVDDLTMVEPTKCMMCVKILCCCSTCRNGKPVLCECSCNDTIMVVNYSNGKRVCIEKMEEPEQIFEQMKQRLHVAKGGPVAQNM